MPPPREPIKTERLVLEPLGPQLLDAAWAAVSSSLSELRPWLVWTKETSRDSIGEFIDRMVGAWDAGTAFAFGILDDEGFAGTIGVHIHNQMLPHAEVGYWIRSDRAGRGYTTEAARAARDFAFDVVGLNRLNLRAGVENVASCRVAEKTGFLREGLMRMGGHGSDRPYDCYFYGMLDSDPRP